MTDQQAVQPQERTAWVGINIFMWNGGETGTENSSEYIFALYDLIALNTEELNYY